MYGREIKAIVSYDFEAADRFITRFTPPNTYQVLIDVLKTHAPDGLITQGWSIGNNPSWSVTNRLRKGLIETGEKVP